MRIWDTGGEKKERKDKSLLGTAGLAAMGLTAAAAAAYGVYILGAKGGRRRPVTELANALDLRIQYVPWREIHYAYYSRPGTGTPLVILHSINAVASAHEMRPLVQHLQRETQRPIFALEWLGFGHSDRLDIPYNPELFVDQLEHFLSRVVRAANGGADVIGLSLGASYAAEVARRRPELVRSLVAIEPTGLGREPGGLGRGWARLLFTLPGVQRAFYDRLTTRDALDQFARDNLFTPEFGVPEEYVDYGFETSRVEGASRTLDEFLSGRLFPEGSRDTFLRLRQPVLIVHGTVQGRRMESYSELPEVGARPNTTVVALPTGAMPHWERPAEVGERIAEFLASQDAAREEPADHGAPATEPAQPTGGPS